jgi:guanylate kinase
MRVILCSSGSEPQNFDIVIENDQLDKAYQDLKEFLMPFIKEVKN